MKLNYRIDSKFTYFTYEIESNNEMSGKGETTILTLKQPKGQVYFEYSVKNPHNDIMAFISVIIFFPFIKNNVTFLFPISQRFIDSFNNLNEFKKTKVHGNIINIKKYKGTKKLITMGGGMDSTSIMCLFKDSYLYFQKGKENVNVDLIANKLNMKEKPYAINTNIKNIVIPNSYTHWISVFIGSLLIAIDKDIGYILLGTPLQNKQFTNKFSRYSFLENLGILFVKPLRGCSELLSCKILVDNNIHKYVVFCDKGGNYKSCHKCSKCFRKNLELYFNGVYYPKNYFNNYSKETIKKSIVGPLSHIFMYKKAEYYKDLIPELYQLLKKYDYNTSWCDKIYSKIYLNCEDKIYLEILSKLKKYGKCMSKNDIYNFENYDVNKYTQNKIIETFNLKKKNIYTIEILVFLIVILLIIKILKNKRIIMC